MSNQDGHRAELRHLLGLIRALNCRGLELMAQLARSDAAPAPPAISRNLALWRGLDRSARERAANQPVLLLDVRFSDAMWWRWACERRPLERKPGAQGYFSPRVAAELMRETITLAWIIARADHGLASILCGMVPAVTRVVSSLDPAQIEQLADQHHRHLRLRFDDLPSYWRMHLKISGSKPILEVPTVETLSEIRQQSLF
ncbi:hypothetical protein JM946_13740 [Steroidobacter sp. S1-65]|uniref:Uncharacterized protein n=2 Tax=Steroidobacter gossypii TaxID=2805490 RepID=A0ABS1WXU5_9GAMM|nr:hypothetical protein [Steroidobacter gossypii]